MTSFNNSVWGSQVVSEVTYEPNQDALNLSLNIDRSNLSEPYKGFYDNAQWITGLIVYPIICTLGLIGNTMIIIVFSRKTMLTSTNIYLCSLAVADIIKLISDFLYFITVLLLELDPVVGNRCYAYLYPYAHFIFNVSVCVSAWLTVSVAVERFLLVCHPAHAKGMITIPRTKMITCLCYVVMTVVAVPSALRYKTVETYEMVEGVNRTMLEVNLTALWQDKRFVITYTWLQSLLRSIIPLFVLIIMNAFIINALRQTRANKKLASRNRITMLLIIVILFFLICITPDAIMSAFFNYGYTESKNYLVKGVREITDFLLAVNAAINFVLYMIFNKLFREQFIATFCVRLKSYLAERPRMGKNSTVGVQGAANGEDTTKYRRLAKLAPSCANGKCKGSRNKIHKGFQQTDL